MHNLSEVATLGAAEIFIDCRSTTCARMKQGNMSATFHVTKRKGGGGIMLAPGPGRKTGSATGGCGRRRAAATACAAVPRSCTGLDYIPDKLTDSSTAFDAGLVEECSVLLGASALPPHGGPPGCPAAPSVVISLFVATDAPPPSSSAAAGRRLTGWDRFRRRHSPHYWRPQPSSIGV